MKKIRKCSVCGSEKYVWFSKKYGNLLCGKHREQFARNGKIFKRTIFDPNEIIIHDNYAEIVLYNKKCEEINRSKIDLNDVDIVRKYKWCLAVRGDVITVINKKQLKLHRLLMNPPDNKQIDHKTRNRLDNRKGNLRIVTDQENKFNLPMQSNNTSGVTGVYRDKSRNKWTAEIHCKYKKIYLGRFSDKQDAIKAYQKAKLKYHKIESDKK